jgi:hypothetical protein
VKEPCEALPIEGANLPLKVCRHASAFAAVQSSEYNHCLINVFRFR